MIFRLFLDDVGGSLRYPSFDCDSPIGTLLPQTYAHGIKAYNNTYSS